MTQKEFSTIASSLPLQPGIYKYFDVGHKLLYVGKAKSLRKRVSSYFTKTLVNYKTQELVQRIAYIEFTIVNNEHDAFLLENSLIKQFQPPFNIHLKDDKTYPYIVIKKEPFPRVFFTRNKINDGSQYIGPFTSVGKVRELLFFIRQNIPLRTCKLNLTTQNIKKGKFKVCLEYHLGNCKGPCEQLQTAEDYEEGLQQVKHILQGDLTPVIAYFKEERKRYAAQLEFEKAAIINKKIEDLQEYHYKSSVVNIRVGTVDVFTIQQESDTAYVNYLAVKHGTIIQTKTITLNRKLEESPAEILTFAIAQLREAFNSNAKEMIVPFEITYPEQDIRITIPRSGDKYKLLELSDKNTSYFREELKKKKILTLEDKDDDTLLEILKELQEQLKLPSLPDHIECFDNSNFQGSYPVSAMVCFKNGRPSKNDYRRFNVKTVKGINDFATMKEVVFRRYKSVLEKKEAIPKLVIIDGGKGQLGAAMESISELGLKGRTTIVGLAKNEEELFFPGDKESIRLPWNSESLHLIRQIRDEVHRFGITFHRNQRSRKTFTNELEQIKGIGSATAELLLKTFKSVKNIRNKSEQELATIIGPAKALLVTTHFAR